MNKTPRELNTAYDLAQQKIIHLKAHKYCFDPLHAVIQDWFTDPKAAQSIQCDEPFKKKLKYIHG